jgi:alpha-L-arabinofuranosidase
LHVFATNRSLKEPASVHVKLADRAILTLESAELLTGPSAKAANSFEKPDVVRSHPFAETGVDMKIAHSEVSLELPPLSVAAMTFVAG